MEIDNLPFIQNQTLKATFRNNIKNSLYVYKKNPVVLLISPTQPYYTDKEKFSSIIELINRSQFKNCNIVVGDTNYQHTLKISHSNDKIAYSLAEKIGSEWIEDNKIIYSCLEMPFTLTRWEYWVNNKRYQRHRERLDLLFNKDNNFRNAFFSSAKEFIRRNQTIFKITDDNYQFSLECCLEYLKEECSVIMPLWAEIGYPFIVYPSKMLAAMQETYNRLVIPYYPTHPHWLSIRYTRQTLSHHESNLVK